MLCKIIFTLLIKFCICNDFYIGMLKPHDILVASDTLYKEKPHFGNTLASYGRLFHCNITYVKVADRLGYGRSPIVTVSRGGLQKKYINLNIVSASGLPISVNIYIGCENKSPGSNNNVNAKYEETIKKKKSHRDETVKDAKLTVYDVQNINGEDADGYNNDDVGTLDDTYDIDDNDNNVKTKEIAQHNADTSGDEDTNYATNDEPAQDDAVTKIDVDDNEAENDKPAQDDAVTERDVDDNDDGNNKPAQGEAVTEGDEDNNDDKNNEPSQDDAVPGGDQAVQEE